VKIATARKIPAPTDAWADQRDTLAAYLMDDATKRGWFAQAVGSDDPDASVLLVPALGFLPASHPLVTKTIDVVRSELGSSDALLLRYKAPDGLAGGEGSFLLCSFWLADVLTFAGRTGEAEAVVRELETYANDVGLWAEETDPASGEARGNFPQAFTHMAHVTSVLHLDAAKSGAIDHTQAHDFSEHAVDRLLAAGRIARDARRPAG
jgi:GH15 family glucan-1,4-alpha-glucosidase